MNEPPLRPGWKEILGHPVHFLAFGFGSGLAPVAPGTFGTLVAVPLYFGMAHLPLALYVVLTAVMLAAGFWICGRSSALLGVHDHSGIVWDEIVGYLIAMTAAPLSWPWVVAGFVLFRLFDVIKPWPVGWADRRLDGGLGIMMDDVFAGLYALLFMQVGLHMLT